MGRNAKFPPLPPKEGEEVRLTVMPKVAVETEADRKREIALLSRVKLEANFDKIVDEIFSLSNTKLLFKGEGDPLSVIDIDVMRLKKDTLQWLADRGYGKAPQIVKLGTDEGTPQALLEKIAQKRALEAVEKLESDRLRAEAITTEVAE